MDFFSKSLEIVVKCTVISVVFGAYVSAVFSHLLFEYIPYLAKVNF